MWCCTMPPRAGALPIGGPDGGSVPVGLDAPAASSSRVPRRDSEGPADPIQAARAPYVQESLDWATLPVED